MGTTRAAMAALGAVLLTAGCGRLGFGGGDPQGAEAANAARAPLERRLAAKGFKTGARVHIRVFKAENRLELWLSDGGRYGLFETYPICRWSGTAGPKIKEGDGQAPEGFYAVRPAQMNAASKYHRAFNLGFPNAYDQALGRTGSALMVHGACVSVGCYAMTDPAIDEIFTLMEGAFAGGQNEIAVDALPFRFDGGANEAPAGRWAGFWSDLAEGDRIFHDTGRPAPAFTCQGRYRFEGGPGCRTVREAD